MQISIDPTIFSKWPAALLGLVQVSGARNQQSSTDMIQELAQIESVVRGYFPTSESIGQHPKIQAWRQAYRLFGSDPHKYRCSSEALARQILRGNTVWGINPLVDCYNYISLKYTIPVGGEDRAAIVDDVQLKLAEGTEQFIRLGGSEVEPPDAGEVIYADAQGVLCRRWNWREADRTKLTAQTTNAILVIEALPPCTLSELESATNELAELVQRWTQASTVTHILSATQPSILIA